MKMWDISLILKQIEREMGESLKKMVEYTWLMFWLMKEKLGFKLKLKQNQLLMFCFLKEKLDFKLKL